MRRGIAVAIKTPLHFQRGDPHRQRHLVDTAVTGYAANAIRHVNAVIKVDKVRQVMNAPPVAPLRQLSTTGASMASLVNSWEWQVMQVAMGGIPAKPAVSTD